MATRLTVLLFLMVLLSGCTVPGRLITNTTMPYTEDFDNTPIGSRKLIIHDYRLREPLSGYSVSAEWTTESIIKEAEKAGITKVNYIDEHTFALLLGIYRRKKLIIYGD